MRRDCRLCRLQDAQASSTVGTGVAGGGLMRLAIVVLVLLMVHAVQAAAAPSARIVRCEQAGEVIYQDSPCAPDATAQDWQPPAGQRLVRRAAHRRGRAPGRARADVRIRAGSAVQRPIGVLIPLHEDPKGCARAKRRQAQLRQAQPHPTLLQQRRWDDALRAACR